MGSCSGNPDAKRLYEDLLLKQNYNKLIRPVSNNSQPITVYLGLKLSQLIDVDEKNQILTTNLWLREAWREPRLSWHPAKYGGITQIRVPSESLWLPEVVMFNNADGNYEVTLMTKASLHNSGKVFWEPPAIYKSSCQIDVEFFPFDKQRCSMKFGSWTYDGLQVDLRHMSQVKKAASSHIIELGIDLEGFYDSTEWDLLGVPARRNEKKYPCCPEPYPDITFTVVLRRKTLFYTVNLIIPCVAISLLTVMVFYLPSDSGEKTTLCISVLLALTLFFLLLAETIPPTSLVVPLIGKYLLFTMVLVTLSIIITVVVLNVHYRSGSTHRMSPWTRKIFLQVLPRLLLMSNDSGKGSKASRSSSSSSSSSNSKGGTIPSAAADANTRCRSWQYSHQQPPAMQTQSSSRTWRNLSQDFIFSPRGTSQPPPEEVTFNFDRNASARRQAAHDLESLLDSEYQQQQQQQQQRHQPPAAASETWQLRSDCPGDLANVAGMRAAIDGAVQSVQFIAEHLKKDSADDGIAEDWMYIAAVMDRLFLWIFSLACVVGTLGIILQAPSIYDTELPINVTSITSRSELAILKDI